MRLIGRLIFVVLVVLFFHSCFDAPHFSNIPEIKFNNIEFAEGIPTTAVPTPEDTLSLTIDFKDGDGDLGIGDQDSNDFRFVNRYYYFLGGNEDSLVTWHTKLVLRDLGQDTLPDYVPPYNCTNWEIRYNTDSLSPKPIDTLYFTLNPNYYNIFVDFYVLQDDGKTFKKFDWLTEFPDNCLVGGYNGRFPILSEDLSRATAEEGKITYRIRSAGLLFTFSIKTLYLSVYIQDRAFHKSNIVNTPTFTLQSILKN